MEKLKSLTATFKNLSARIIFCFQVSVAILALPSLYMIGVSQNVTEKESKDTIIMTNKGKKIIVTTSYYSDNNKNTPGNND